MEQGISYNPYTKRLAVAKHRCDQLKLEISSCKEDIAWYGSFDPATCNARLGEITAQEAKYSKQITDIEMELAHLLTAVQRLEVASSLGFAPSRWPFASERLEAKAEFRRLSSRSRILESRKTQQNADLERIWIEKADIEESISRYGAMKLSEISAYLAKLSAELDVARETESRLKTLEQKRFKLLQVPLNDLQRVDSEIRQIEKKISLANDLDRRLGEAENSYERKQIHVRAQRELGEDRPQKVIASERHALKTVKRDKDKLERRIEELIRRDSLVIESIVIDGSNLCYENDRFVGLYALRALCASLPHNASVTVFFDESIVGKLGLPSDSGLSSELPGLDIRLVGGRSGADEVILDAAEDATAFVISGDRFSEYPDKSAVANGRLLDGYVINGRVLVSDLRINVKYLDNRHKSL